MEWMAFVLTLCLSLVPAAGPSVDVEDYIGAIAPSATIAAPYVTAEPAATAEPAMPIETAAPEIAVPEITEAPAPDSVVEQKGGKGQAAPTAASFDLSYATDDAVIWADEFAALWRNADNPFRYEIMEPAADSDYPTLLYGYVGEAISMDFYLFLEADEYWCYIVMDGEAVPLRQVEEYRKLFSSAVTTAYAAYYEDITMGQFNQLEAQVDAIAEALSTRAVTEGNGDESFFHDISDSYFHIYYDMDWNSLECYISF